MKFYEIPIDFDKEIASFEQSLHDFVRGELHPTKFRAIRVPFGIYQQRTENTYMVRIRATAGGITPAQLQKSAELAEQYGRPLVHVTTRQEIQLHDLQLNDIPEILRELYSVDLSSRGGGGNTVRNIMASYDSGINSTESFDVTPHAVALSSRLIAENDSWSFPRKFKISFSNTENDNALAAFNDLGFIATTQEGRKGFKVFVAGGMGCRPRLSKVLHDFIKEDNVYYVCAAIKNLFLEHGNRKTKNSGRLRFLWEELGKEKFLAIYHDNLTIAKSKDVLSLDHDGFINKAHNDKPTGVKPKNVAGQHFIKWQNKFVSSQKQTGLKSVTIPLNLGDIRCGDAIKLSRFLALFGTNTIRLTMTQNIQVRNLPEEYLGNLYEQVSEISTISHLPRLCSQIIACTGANTCTTGVCLPHGVVPVIQNYLTNSELTSERVQDVRLHISGCPNSCGQHHVGDLGFYGRVARKGSKTLPGYWITGGSSINPETRAYTDKCGWVAAKDLPQLVVDILADYGQKADGFKNFGDYFHHDGSDSGKQVITDLCKKLSEQIPGFEDDKSYYHDWGTEEEFTTAHMGHGECSAGIYDMIEVSMTAIKEYLSSNIAQDPKERQKTAKDLVYHSASMLLVTRGVDPASETEIFDAFLHHFIDKGLVDVRFRDIVKAAKGNDGNYLGANLEVARELGETMIQLYHNMDNRLRFTCEDEQICKNETLPKVTAVIDKIHSKDLRGVACPMNFVKTKVELAKIAVGVRLQILLDDGEPIDNVPRSVKTEGHQIVSQEQKDDHWVVVIEKSA